MIQSYYNEDTTDEWSIRTTQYEDYPGWSFVHVLSRRNGILLWSGAVRDGQVTSTVILALKRYEDMEKDRIDPGDDPVTKRYGAMEDERVKSCT